MTLQSMTGFARVEGSSGRYRWAWELRSVNGKGLDLRTRLPQGHEGLEADIRRLAGERLTRGNIQIGLSVTVSENKVEAVLNRDALAAGRGAPKMLGWPVCLFHASHSRTSDIVKTTHSRVRRISVMGRALAGTGRGPASEDVTPVVRALRGE